ncbi:MAG: replication-relaxation family protein [Chloroflexota bacterium]|nr:replication-relaxation family protein [Chloroflexota bacterium]
MQTKQPATPAPTKKINPDQTNLNDAIREYVRVHQRSHGQKATAEALGVSRHSLWRYLEQGHIGRAVPAAVLDSFGGSVKDIEAATLEIIIDLEGLRPDPALRPLRQSLEDALLLLCAAPLATVDELARFGRIPATTLRERLDRLAERGLVDTVSHHLGVLGSRPQRRYFPTDKGVTAAGAATQGRKHMLTSYPLSKQWFRLLAERLDAVAVLYRVAAMIADADPKQAEVRVDHHRHGPYDLLATLSGGLTAGVIRQGPMLPTSNLRYRLRSIEHLPSNQRPFLTLVLTHADQATRRAVRALGDPSERRRTFAATEGELLAGDHTDVVWQQCGYGLGLNPPVEISPETSLAAILSWADGLMASSHRNRRDNPGPDADALYSSNVQAAMPEPAEQLASALAVHLSKAEKDVLDLLAAWPLCSREQLAGLMGGVTLRRVNQALRPLREHRLVQEDDALLMLTDRGLTYLARRDRAAVGLTLDRWTAQPAISDPRVYAGTALRALASQPHHHSGVTDFAASLTAEVSRSDDHDLFDLLPTHRSSIGYRCNRTNYMIHPDASFTLEYKGKWLPFLLEFERRATTPKRIPKRLASYRRYFTSGWAERDHGGRTPGVLFVFETPESEAAFLDVADGMEGLGVITANAEALGEHGVLGEAWILPPPHSLDRAPLAGLY